VGSLYSRRRNGVNHFDQRAKTKHVQRLVNRLESLGYDVKILPKAASDRVVSLLGHDFSLAVKACNQG
jgi:hypothetical protein